MIRPATVAAAAAFLLAASAFEPSSSAGAREIESGQGIPSVASAPPTNAAVAFRYVTTPTGNAARYRIREQLVGIDLPNDAVGETGGVIGTISADSRGNVIATESRFTVDVSTLKSDKDRRDNFVRRRVLETEANPNVTFVPKSLKGLGLPLPKSGRRSFEIIGDLTVKGKTRPAAWRVDAQFTPDRITGAATTSFTFADYGIEQPRVPVVLSVDETIKLELDFTLVPAR